MSNSQLLQHPKSSSRVSPAQAASELLLRRKARKGLMDFTCYTFGAYSPADHLHLIAQKLEAVERGEIKRLMIFAPPRHGKTELTSVRFPAFCLGRNQQRQIIGASYAEALAYSNSFAVRTTIESPAYQRLWPIQLDRSGAVRWQLEGKENNRASYIAAGVGGGITGEGADIIIIDDPVKNREEAESQVIRDKVWDWYRTVARTRLHPGGVVILIMTRWHADDLAGRLIKQAKEDPQADQWEVLNLQAIQPDGSALWPEQYPVDALQAIRATIGPRHFSALYMGSPMEAEGNMFNREWFQIVDAAPARAQRVRRWDMAATESKGKNDPDWTVGVKMSRTIDGVYYVEDVRRIRANPGDVENLIKQTAQVDGIGTVVYMEQEPGSSGKTVIDHYTRQVLNGFAFYGLPSTGNKQLRAMPLSSQAQAGNIKLVRGSWNAAFLDELEIFPLGAHDDQVDAASGALQDLGGAATPLDEGTEEVAAIASAMDKRPDRDQRRSEEDFVGLRSRDF